MVLPKTEAVWANGGPRVMAPDLDQGDGTIECSSSFGDTSSGFGGEADGGELEVNSVFSAHATGGGSSKLPRRKKVTAEWRNSVGPVLWRCQWLELRMKELSSQVSKYDRELALIKKEKEIQQQVSKANGSMSDSMQIHKGHGNSIMKRRKRKRHEENADAPLYIYEHQMLSYYHDKQNKGVTGDLLIDDDCGSVDGNIRGGLDAVALLDSENYDTIFEQLTLKGTLVTIEGLQSRVHLLQDRLSKVLLSGGENLTLPEDYTHVRVPWKKQHTQKRPFSSTKCQYTKPQKMKNLNILLKDDESTLPGRPAFPDRETEAHIKDANRNAEERSGECNHSREKSVIVDLLLGTANFIPNCHIGDLCKENTDDILIDNQAANEVCQQFDDAKHLPSGTSSRGQNISGPAEMKTTCAPVEVNNTCPPVVEAVSPQIKQELKPKKRTKKSSFFTKKQRKEASKTHDAKKKTEDTSSAAKNKTGITLSAAADKTEHKPSGASAMEPGTMAACSAGVKRKNEPADKKHEALAPKKQKTVKLSSATKKQETVKLSSAAKKQESVKLSSSANKQETVKLSSSANKKKTENPSSAGKKQKTENPSSAAKNQETENVPATKETESAPLNLKTEKAVLVAVNSRRSQRVRKPKVFAE